MYKKNVKKLELQVSKVTVDGNTKLDDTKETHIMHHQNLYQKGPACILPNLYLGAYHNTFNTQQLKSMGINCIINVAREIKHVVPTPGISYHHLAWTHCQPNLARSEFNNAIQTIMTAHNHNQIVLIHCQQGIERSATLVLAFLLFVGKRKEPSSSSLWTLDKAMAVVKEKAPGIRPNMELLYQLREYEKSLQSHTSHRRRRRTRSVTSSHQPWVSVASSRPRRSTSLQIVSASDPPPQLMKEKQALAVTSLLVLLIVLQLTVSKRATFCKNNRLHGCKPTHEHSTSTPSINESTTSCSCSSNKHSVRNTVYSI